MPRTRNQGQPVNPTLAEHEANYWAPDREDVLANLRGLGPSQNVVPDTEQQPVQQMDRNTFRDAWMGAGQMTPQQADQWLRQHGAQQLQGGEKAGRWQVPGGDQLDLQIGRGGALASGGMITPGWTAIGGGGQTQGMGPSPSAMGSMFGAMSQQQKPQMQQMNRMQQGMQQGQMNRPMQPRKPMRGGMQQGAKYNQPTSVPNQQAQQMRQPFGQQQQPKYGF
jgi:hypothetical protein